jgi:hypothetical protein
MGSKRFYLLVGIAVVILGVVVAGLVSLYRQPGESGTEEEAFRQKVAALRPGPGVRVTARAKEDPRGGFPATPWVDITEYADLLFKLIQPPVPSEGTVTNAELLCEVKIQRDDEEVVLNILWGGKGKLWFTQPGLRVGFIRERSYYPLERDPDIYTDEGMAFSALVLAVAQKDKASRTLRKDHLRTSLGLPTDTPPR